MYALREAAHHLTGALVQRNDCAYKTVDEVRSALRRLEDFTQHLHSDWPNAQSQRQAENNL